MAAYDILTVKNGVLRNVTQNTASSAADGGFRFLSLYPTDIDGSGVIEIPEPVPFPPLDEESETYYRILWRDYDSAGKSEVVCRTFHNAADGWSLLLPETWDERVSLLRAGTPDENAVLFFCRSSDGQLQPFLEICALTAAPVRSTPGAATALCSPDRSRPFTPPSSCPATTGTARSTRRP